MRLLGAVLLGLAPALLGCAEDGQGEPTIFESTARAAIRALGQDEPAQDEPELREVATGKGGTPVTTTAGPKRSVPPGPKASSLPDPAAPDDDVGDEDEALPDDEGPLEGEDDEAVVDGLDEGVELDDQEDEDEQESEYEVVDEAVVLAQARAQGVRTPEEDRFFDVPDAALRARMAVLPIAKIKRGSGGRSLGFKITLVDGTKGYFKAEQTFSAANWNSEVAAYHLDRMLGMYRVPPVVSRKLPWEVLREAAGRDKRKDEIIVRRDDTVRGGFVWWIPGGLRTWPDLPGWEQWVRVRGWPSTTVSPMQRPAKWAHQLRLRREHGDEWLSPQERHRRRNFNPKPDRPDRPEELSDMIVFDYLTKNIDRWGGRNANVLIRGRRGALVFLDNGAGFAPGRARPSLIESRLHVLQRFRRSTVRALKSFDIETFEKRLDSEPLAPILHTREFRHLSERRKALLDWIRRMQRRYGERATPWE